MTLTFEQFSKYSFRIATKIIVVEGLEQDTWITQALPAAYSTSATPSIIIEIYERHVDETAFHSEYCTMCTDSISRQLNETEVFMICGDQGSEKCCQTQ